MAIRPAKKRFRDRREAQRRAAAEAEKAGAPGAQEEANITNDLNDASNDTNGDLYSTQQTEFPPSQKRLRQDDDFDLDTERAVEEENLRRREASTPPGDHRLRDPRDRIELSETPVPFHDDWSDPDTASIASHDSDDLASRRPNRWRGNPRAWQHITELDRAVFNAMSRTRDRDLAAHLYNAFRMKQDVDPMDPDAWAPKAYWTAWPLRLRDTLGLNVFDDNGNSNAIFAAAQTRTGYAPDTKDPPIFNNHEPPAESRPSGPLEEMLTATIQRVAREQFYLRQQTLQQQERQGAGLDQSEGDNTTEAATTAPDTTNIDVDVDADADTDDASPAVLADDELAADLLQPSVRHLLAQVDKVLSILHNARVSTAAFGEDGELSSAAAAASAARSRRQRSPSVDAGAVTDTGAGTGARPIARRLRLPPPSKKQVCRRPKDWESSPELMLATTREGVWERSRLLDVVSRPEEVAPSSYQARNEEPTYTKKSLMKEADARGRPTKKRPTKKRERLSGETEKQFLIRIARESHRRLPDFSDDEEDEGCEEEDRVIKKEEEKAQVQLPGRKETAVPIPRVIGDRRKAPSSPARQRRVSFADNDGSLAVRPREMKGFVGDGASDTDINDGYESDWQTGDEETNAQKRKRISSTATRSRPADRTVARWPLRNWADVLGAAALSGGFSAEVLARATQRCSDLFGQSMSLDTLAGVELGKGELPDPYRHNHATHKPPLSVGRHVYNPGAAGPYPGLSELPDETDTTGLENITIAVRRAHVRRQARLAKRNAFIEERLAGWERQRGEPDTTGQEEGTVDSDDSDEDDGSDAQAKGTPTQSRPQSTTAVPLLVIPGAPLPVTPKPRSTPIIWYCPRPNCPRAVDGFARRQNMKRHLKLMHNMSLGDSENVVTPSPLP